MDPTIEALTIHPAAWAALLQGLAEGVAYGAAAIGSVLVVTVVSIAGLGGRKAAEGDLDRAPEPQIAVAGPEGESRDLGGIVPTVWGTPRVTGARRRRRVCQRARGPWSVIARQPESVG